jgi:hypothetical protein
MNNFFALHEIQRKKQLCNNHSCVFLTDLNLFFEHITKSAAVLIFEKEIKVSIALINLEQLDCITTVPECTLNMNFIHKLQLLSDVPLVNFVPHDDLDGIYFLGIIFTRFRDGSLRDLRGRLPLYCGYVMVLLLYLVDLGLCTCTDLLMNYVFFEVFLSDDLLVQRRHPLLKDLGYFVIESYWIISHLEC